MKINANIPALQAARHMNKTNDKIQSSLAKLSSGYKINSVADDPTGTAVSSKIKAQLYGLKIAGKNALDGVSLVQTAEGAMSEINEMLKRIRELSVQAANDTNAPDDRRKIQTEVDELLDAIDQMSEVTEFNQMKLLNGRLSNLTTIMTEDISTGDMVRNYDLSVDYMSTRFPVGDYEIKIKGDFSCAELDAFYHPGGSSITLNTDTIEIDESDSDETIKEKLTDLADRYNCIVEFGNWPPTDPSDADGYKFTFRSKETGSKVSLEMSGTAVEFSPAEEKKVASGMDAEIELVSGFSDSAVWRVEGNRIFITDNGGEQLQIDINKNLSVGTGGERIYNLKIEDKGQLKLQTGANEEQRVALMIPGLSTFSLGLRKQAFASDAPTDETVNLLNVKNTYGAERSIGLIDEAAAKLSTMRSTLGAYQVRLERTVSSLDLNSVNTEESLSRIQDTDMAIEMSRYTLNNVILQSAISMLSQANERPQQLLQLLR